MKQCQLNLKTGTLILASLIFLQSVSFAQFTFRKVTNIPVTENNDPKKFPWTGGFNNPQFSGVDINNDGIKDLVAFDRTGDKAITFINNGTSNVSDYIYDPKYEAAFSNFIQWMLMDDFDCDGVPDVFTFHVGAADYYKGRYAPNNTIGFDSVTFLGYHSSFSGYLNIFISPVDIPAIVDVNNDGDLDVLTFHQLGGTLVYYENQSQELTGTCGDTVMYKLITECWGDFFETNFCGATLDACGGFPTDSCIFFERPHSAGQVRHNRHSGSTVMAYDDDGDGDKEVILGDISCQVLDWLRNGGDEDCADMDLEDSTFPSYDVPYQSPIFPAPFYVDVDNDNIRDLLVSPNEPRASENYKCIWFYKNVGTEDSVHFQLVSDTFLISETLDFGEGAYPVFFDYNSDSLLDLVVGNYGYYLNGVTYRTGLALLENVGSPTAPAFELVDRDWQSLTSLGRKALYPAFGDLDGDGDQDMVVGEFDGYLHFFRNTAGPGTASFTLEMPQMFDIDVGQFSAPFIYDVNRDGLLDLVLGEKSGNLDYFENTGTATNFKFDTDPTNSFFGEVITRVPGFPDGYSNPVITTLDSSSTLYLLAGSDEGQIRTYLYDTSMINGGAFPKLFNNYSKIDEGEKIAIAVADLTGDGKMEMVAGNYRGGLAFFTQSDTIYTPVSDISVKNEFARVEIFPNPANDAVTIRLALADQKDEIGIELFDLLGKSLRFVKQQAAPTMIFHLPDAADGIYFLRLSSGQKINTQKLIIQR